LWGGNGIKISWNFFSFCVRKSRLVIGHQLFEWFRMVPNLFCFKKIPCAWAARAQGILTCLRAWRQLRHFHVELSNSTPPIPQNIFLLPRIVHLAIFSVQRMHVFCLLVTSPRMYIWKWEYATVTVINF